MVVVRNFAIFLFGLIALGAIYVDGFPDGAPVDVCVKPKPNRPYHGQAEPQPLAQNPYKITASSGVYGPGSQVTVTIRNSSFKGFFLQARDVKTDAWIGSWIQTPNTKTHDECSAITHADPRDKQEATLIWNAPANAQGQVYFTLDKTSKSQSTGRNDQIMLNQRYLVAIQNLPSFMNEYDIYTYRSAANYPYLLRNHYI